MQAAVELEAIPGIRLSGEIIAENISFEDFLIKFPGEHLEWFDGYVITMSGIEERHDALTRFFSILFSYFLELTGGGRVLQDPMIMRTRPDLPARAPDLQVLLPASLGLLKHNFVAGAADLVVEVISSESERRDRVEKFAEYELAGVREYWIFDWRFGEALFFQLDEQGKYHRAELDENGVYHSKVLNRLQLPVVRLWEEQLPGVGEIVRMVEAMLTAQ
jgi:Uma2 family endonuclease